MIDTPTIGTKLLIKNRAVLAPAESADVVITFLIENTAIYTVIAIDIVHIAVFLIISAIAASRPSPETPAEIESAKNIDENGDTIYVPM